MKYKNKTAVVLVSGGMDSLVTTAIVNEEYEPALLHINYGQRTEKKELWAFNKLAEHYKTDKTLIVKAEHFKKIGGSSLTDIKIKVTKSNLNNKIIPSSYVPFRNAYFLSIAVSWAEVINASNIFIGAVEEDSSGYPDCRKKFYDKYNELIKLGTRPETNITVKTPIIHMNKSEIIKKGIELKAPFEYSWSCYKNNDVACGECDSCVLRLNAFKNAGIKDPIKYKKSITI